MVNKTFNFRVADYDYDYPENKGGTVRDLRNNIFCTNPSYNLECYVNYISLLNSFRDKWVSYAYLDHGLMPLMWLPSFMAMTDVPELIEFQKEYKFKPYILPAVCVMSKESHWCSLSGSDIWISKLEVGTKLGIPEESVTFERMLRKGGLI